jgi:hypothetical protein
VRTPAPSRTSSGGAWGEAVPSPNTGSSRHFLAKVGGSVFPATGTSRHILVNGDGRHLPANCDGAPAPPMPPLRPLP